MSGGSLVFSSRAHGGARRLDCAGLSAFFVSGGGIQSGAQAHALEALRDAAAVPAMARSVWSAVIDPALATEPGVVVPAIAVLRPEPRQGRHVCSSRHPPCFLSRFASKWQIRRDQVKFRPRPSIASNPSDLRGFYRARREGTGTRRHEGCVGAKAVHRSEARLASHYPATFTAAPVPPRAWRAWPQTTPAPLRPRRVAAADPPPVPPTPRAVP